MSSPPNIGDKQPAVVGVSPSSPTPSLKPLIADILRTRYCVSGSIFLVEGVDADITLSKKHRAVRLLLGDGDFVIQALLRGELHEFVERGSICPGRYVQLEKFQLRWLKHKKVHDDEGGSRHSIHPSVEDEIVFLVVEDLVTVGWNNAFLKLLKGQITAPLIPEIMFAVTGDGFQEKHTAEKKTLSADPNTVLDPLEVDDEFETMTVSEERATQRRLEAAAMIGGPSNGKGDHNIPSSLAANAWISDNMTRPLKLTPLRSIPFLPYKQNWTVNVLAVVASLSDVEPSALPPGTQRTARLADPSTTKQILLTVFLDPEDFTPRVGAVVLLVGVKNHRFDGGCLKKYSNERPRGGHRWWFQEPSELSWCDVSGLQTWWETRVA